MEELFERLVIAVEQQSFTFPWSDVMSTFLSFAAILVTSYFGRKNAMIEIVLICKYHLSL